MLRFEPGIFCRNFRLEVALVLHHAAAWATLARIGVTVNSLGDRRHGPKSQHPYDLAVDLDTDGDKPDHLKLLGEYLSRVLSAEYDVIVEADHVHVEWDNHRPKAELVQPFV